jgi:hypothetical protein
MINLLINWTLMWQRKQNRDIRNRGVGISTGVTNKMHRRREVEKIGNTVYKVGL